MHFWQKQKKKQSPALRNYLINISCPCSSPQKQQAGVKSDQLLSSLRQISTSATKIITARRCKNSMERRDVWVWGCVYVCVGEKEKSMVRMLEYTHLETILFLSVSGGFLFFLFYKVKDASKGKIYMNHWVIVLFLSFFSPQLCKNRTARFRAYGKIIQEFLVLSIPFQYYLSVTFSCFLPL